MDEFVYQNRIYEPAAPWAGRDGWSGWSVISQEDYEYYLLKADPEIEVRCLKVFSVQGKPV